MKRAQTTLCDMSQDGKELEFRAIQRPSMNKLNTSNVTFREEKEIELEALNRDGITEATESKAKVQV